MHDASICRISYQKTDGDDAYIMYVPEQTMPTYLGTCSGVAACMREYMYSSERRGRPRVV